MAELNDGFAYALAQKPGYCYGCVNFETRHGWQQTGVRCMDAKCTGTQSRIIVRSTSTGTRANDPHTSKAAAEAVKPKRASIKLHILTTLATPNPADGGGYAWTGTEIAAKNGLRLNSVTPRFAELRREEKIKATTTVRNGEVAWVSHD